MSSPVKPPRPRSPSTSSVRALRLPRQHGHGIALGLDLLDRKIRHDLGHDGLGGGEPPADHVTQHGLRVDPQPGVADEPARRPRVRGDEAERQVAPRRFRGRPPDGLQRALRAVDAGDDRVSTPSAVIAGLSSPGAACGTTVTGPGACRTHCMPTEPRTALRSAPRPRCPTTSRSASAACSTSTAAAGPGTAHTSTGTSVSAPSWPATTSSTICLPIFSRSAPSSPISAGDMP